MERAGWIVLTGDVAKYPLAVIDGSVVCCDFSGMKEHPSRHYFHIVKLVVVAQGEVMCVVRG